MDVSAIDQVAPVRHLAERPGPFLSVFLPSPGVGEDAHDRLRISFKDVRAELERQGADTQMLERARRALPERSGGVDAFAVIVAGDGQTWHGWIPSEVAPPAARFGPIPSLGPLIGAAQALPTHVIVLVDRVGADIVTVVGGEPRDVREVEGDDDVQKVDAGGWSQRKYQQRTQNTWEHNAAGVAEEVATIVWAVRPRVVIAAGDERALGFLREHLPKEVNKLVREADTGGRAVDGSEDLLAEQVERIVATVVAEKKVQLMEEFTARRAKHTGAVDGPEETFELLREAMVGALLVHDEPSDERLGWCQPDVPTLVAVEQSTLESLGVEGREARLVDVALWSAVRTGAEIYLVPKSGPHVPHGGIGGLVRGLAGV